MKKVILTMLCALMAMCGYGQGFALSSDLLNVAYAGIDNDITVAAEGYTRGQLQVSTNNGVITRGAGCKFRFKPVRPGNDSVCVKGKTAGGLKTLGYVTLRIVRLPDPVARITERADHPKHLDYPPGIFAKIDDFDLEIVFSILDYHIEVIRNGKVIHNVFNIGAIFSINAKNALATMQPGDKLIISKIRCLGPDKEIRNLKNITRGI